MTCSNTNRRHGLLIAAWTLGLAVTQTSVEAQREPHSRQRLEPCQVTEPAPHPQTRRGAAAEYIDANESEYEWFVHAANSYQGVPFLLLRVLPDLEPKIFGEPGDAFRKFGFTSTKQDRQNNRPLPTGLAWDPMASPADGRAAPPIRSVSLSCAACHLGQVRTEHKILDLVGAPNTQIDVRAWRHAFERLVEKRLASPADIQTFAERVKTAIEDKPQGYFYRESTPDREAQERQVFSQITVPVLNSLAERIVVNKMAVDLQRISSYGKDNHPPLNGGSVGQSDGSGDLIPKLLSLDAITSAQPQAAADDVVDPVQVQRAVADALQRFLGNVYPAIVVNNATVTDNLSTWQQGRRRVAQLDGSVRSPFFRNIAAILAVAGSPSNVNARNAAFTARFLNDLPPPAYPFAIDQTKAAEGQKLFQQHCAVCHFQGNDAVYRNVKTDMNRATVLRESTVKLFLRHFRASVPDGFTYKDSGGNEVEPLQLDADDIVNADRATPEHQGYIAGGLEGVWARAPYLHNGSVPTLRHLLGPSNKRPQRFVRGSIDFDTDRVGFAWRPADLVVLNRKDPVATIYNCDWDGCSNKGHDKDIVVDGKKRKLDWSDDINGMEQLIEYLKTL